MAISVSKKVWLPIIFAAIGFGSLLFYSRMMIVEQMMGDRIAKIRTISESAVSVVAHYEREATSGRLSADAAKAAAKDALRDLRYDGKDGYIYIYSTEGVNVLLPTKPEVEGKSLIDLKDPTGFAIVRDFIKQTSAQGYGVTRYLWEKPGSSKPEPKASYTILFKPWNWMVGTGIYVDDVEKESDAATMKLLGISALFLALIVLPSAWVGRQISRPITQLTDSMRRLADGDLETEIGEMAKTLGVFKDNVAERRRLEAEAETKERQRAEEHQALMMKLADDFESAIGDILRGTSSTARNLTELSRVMAENADRTTKEAETVRVASDMASRNVETVA